MCGSPIPDDQGSQTCSMCYGDIDHGKDNYYKNWLDDQDVEEQRDQEPEQQPDPQDETTF